MTKRTCTMHTDNKDTNIWEWYSSAMQIAQSHVLREKKQHLLLACIAKSLAHWYVNIPASVITLVWLKSQVHSSSRCEGRILSTARSARNTVIHWPISQSLTQLTYLSLIWFFDTFEKSIVVGGGGCRKDWEYKILICNKTTKISYRATA